MTRSRSRKGIEKDRHDKLSKSPHAVCSLRISHDRDEERQERLKVRVNCRQLTEEEIGRAMMHGTSSSENVEHQQNTFNNDALEYLPSCLCRDFSTPQRVALLERVKRSRSVKRRRLAGIRKKKEVLERLDELRQMMKLLLQQNQKQHPGESDCCSNSPGLEMPRNLTSTPRSDCSRRLNNNRQLNRTLPSDLEDFNIDEIGFWTDVPEDESVLELLDADEVDKTLAALGGSTTDSIGAVGNPFNADAHAAQRDFCQPEPQWSSPYFSAVTQQMFCHNGAGEEEQIEQIGTDQVHQNYGVNPSPSYCSPSQLECARSIQEKSTKDPDRIGPILSEGSSDEYIEFLDEFPLQQLSPRKHEDDQEKNEGPFCRPHSASDIRLESPEDGCIVLSDDGDSAQVEDQDIIVVFDSQCQTQRSEDGKENKSCECSTGCNVDCVELEDETIIIGDDDDKSSVERLQVNQMSNLGLNSVQNPRNGIFGHGESSGENVTFLEFVSSQLFIALDTNRVKKMYFEWVDQKCFLPPGSLLKRIKRMRAQLKLLCGVDSLLEWGIYEDVTSLCVENTSAKAVKRFKKQYLNLRSSGALKRSLVAFQIRVFNHIINDVILQLHPKLFRRLVVNMKIIDIGSFLANVPMVIGNKEQSLGYVVTVGSRKLCQICGMTLSSRKVNKHLVSEKHIERVTTLFASS